MAAIRILKFHARLHGSVIALNDADAYATSGAYFCVNSRISHRAQIMEFSSRRRGNNDNGKKRRRDQFPLCVIVVNRTSPASSLSPRRHLDRRQKTKRPSTNNALAWLTRAILMRRIVWSLENFAFQKVLLRFLGVFYSVSVPLHSRVDRATYSALPGCISEKRRARSPNANVGILETLVSWQWIS